MNWISVKDKKPTNYATCLVINAKYNLEPHIALYNHNYDVFNLYNPNSITKYTLEVTHYIEINNYPELIGK